ncbi:hypothetical protein [Streptomyces sp. 184]|uniref:hypothetical protein n=1 Tax=Streptomyces sp. 184 TaxID=1827526 RepID=UPI003891C274
MNTKLERYRNRKRREYNLHQGIPNRLPPDEARQRLMELRQTMSWNQIAEATACSAAHMRRILRGDAPNINRHTHQKIMAARPAGHPAGGVYIDATGSVRRVRALAAIGHTQQAIAEAAGTGTCRVSRLALGATTVRQVLADKIHNAYVQLSNVPGASVQSRNLAARRKWAPPLAWDDETIDDPKARPDFGQKTPRAVALAEDALWLINTQGYDRAHAAERLGVKRCTLDAAIARSGLTQSDTEQAA